MPTIAEQWKKEGFEKGIQKGKMKGILEADEKFTKEPLINTRNCSVGRR